MNIIGPIKFLEELFSKENDFLLSSFEDETLTYKEFFQLAKDKAQNINESFEETCKETKNSLVSLTPNNTREDLINILAYWLAGRVLIFHAPETSAEFIKEYEALISKDLKTNELLKDKTIACYILTSGSTARPKPIPLSFENLFSASKKFCKHFNVNDQCYLPITLPLYHVGGLMIFIRSITEGAKLSLHNPGKISPEDFPQCPSFMSVVPLQLERILDNKEQHEFYRECTFIIGGAKTSHETLSKIEQYKFKASSTYGMSETCAMVMATKVTSKASVLRSIGMPLENVDISLDSRSALIIKSDSTSPIFRDGVIVTNDMAYTQEDLFYIKGRIDDVFISGGENINPLEVESTLIESGISDAFVIPVEDEKLGMMSTLFYTGKQDQAEIKQLASSNLPPFKRPRYYFKVPDYAFTGIKLKKSILKEVAPLLVSIERARELFPLTFSGDPRRPWIILLHGFMGEKEDWNKIQELLRVKFFTIALDLPGHGENRNLTSLSLEKLQMDFAELAQLLAKPFHLLGYSQGGRLALGLVMRGLEVESLILESASAGIVDEDEREKRYQSDLKLFSRISNQSDLREFLIYWYENPLFGKIKEHQDFEHFINKRSQYDWKLWSEALKSFSVGIQPDYRPFLQRRKDLNALTICGERDHKYLAASMELKTRYGLNFEKISDCSHNTHFERPEEFANTICKFLES
ncbi:putative AMP-binding hydrolase enzyme [Halobacteriovorax marinus SJ]|uniref:AMP-binding hydrolase enzyme n=1 Tax=Halobacteriovorax marinus (strain ATCC BAA-682 / DSM 15412 / SJ) TaxID=862908 RepID=E1X1A0_HALMS|nr:alpha/beta fold hydrolase [Halobacteriovorax marinus]CBW26491.1 putative AMP-binding hydrolase enzyme [Halobacteriovorax marinus SJ]